MLENIFIIKLFNLCEKKCLPDKDVLKAAFKQNKKNKNEASKDIFLFVQFMSWICLQHLIISQTEKISIKKNCCQQQQNIVNITFFRFGDSIPPSTVLMIDINIINQMEKNISSFSKKKLCYQLNSRHFCFFSNLMILLSTVDPHLVLHFFIRHIKNTLKQVNKKNWRYK